MVLETKLQKKFRYESDGKLFESVVCVLTYVEAVKCTTLWWSFLPVFLSIIILVTCRQYVLFMGA